MTVALDRLGLDRGKLSFAFRTAAAACVALFVAWALNLDHPQWAAMSVWAASQPLRGQLFEKCAFRVLGTVMGTIAGVLLIQAMHIHPYLLVLGLAVWVAICTGLGNLQRGFVAYGTVLAGYTAAMVSLLDVAHPDHVFAIGVDRLATVLTGVVIATLAGLIFAGPRADRAILRRQINGLVADILDHLAAIPGDPQTTDEQRAALLAQIANIEEGLDPQAAGSVRSRHEIRATRAVLLAGVGALLQQKLVGPKTSPDTATLSRAAAELRQGSLSEATDDLASLSPTDPYLAEALLELRQALLNWDERAETAETAPPPVLPLHRDWIGAREAMLRAGGVLLFAGAVWQLTGWSSGNFMLLGLSVMISIFSTFENPVALMRWVFLGQLCGLVGMLTCRWLVWPFVETELQMILTAMPFVLFGAFLTSHRRTGPVSFDYNMVLLLLLQPHWPLSGTIEQSLLAGVSVLTAPLIAWAMYSVIFPANLKRRIETLIRMMRHDLADLAKDPSALRHRRMWRVRLYHRTSRLIRMSARFGRETDYAIAQSLSSLKAGQTIMHLHQALEAPNLSRQDRRAFKLALARAERMLTDPLAAEATLARIAPRLEKTQATSPSPAVAA